MIQQSRKTSLDTLQVQILITSKFRNNPTIDAGEQNIDPLKRLKKHQKSVQFNLFLAMVTPTSLMTHNTPCGGVMDRVMKRTSGVATG